MIMPLRYCLYYETPKAEPREEIFVDILENLDILPGELEVFVICPVCGKKIAVRGKLSSFREFYLCNTHVQRAFEYLDENLREALVSGICDTCWKNIF